MKSRQKKLMLGFDRILSQDTLGQIIILVALLAAVFIVSFLLLSLSGSDWLTYCKANNISKWVFPLYLLIDGNAFHDFCSAADVSRTSVFLACLIYIAGVVIFTGMLISVMTNIIERRVEDHRSGRIHYLLSGHYVIMGYDDKVPSFIKYIFSLKKDELPYVLLLTAANVADVAEKLRKNFNDEQMKHIIINFGHRTTSESYKDIHLESAEEIFIVGNHSQAAHDAINVECVDCICDYLTDCKSKNLPKRITCVFKDLDTYAAFKTSDIFGEVGELDIEFVPYNFYAGWAKQVFVKRCHKDLTIKGIDTEITYPSVFGNGIVPDDPKFVHLVFVGTTNFAVAFAMEAAQILHFPNFNNNGNRKLRTRITFVDLNADIEKDEFITRNRHFFEVQPYRYQDLSEENPQPTSSEVTSTTNDDSKYIRTDLVRYGDRGDFLDVEFEFIKGNIFSQRVQNEIRRWANATDEQYLSIFLAMANQRSNFLISMNMPDEVYDKKVPVFVRQDRSDNFVTNLRNADSETYRYSIIKNGEVDDKEVRDARYAHIYPFGMNETTYSADVKSIKRAKLINYLYKTADYTKNKFQDELALAAIPEKEIWREADDKWKELSVALKWSNLYSSYTIRIKQATLSAMRDLDLTKIIDTSHLSQKEVEVLARVEHNRWNVEKLLMGFRKPYKDEDKYEAPDKDAEQKLERNKDLYIHHDIRPYEQLNDIAELDKEFSRYIPWIIKMTENEI